MRVHVDSSIGIGVALVVVLEVETGVGPIGPVDRLLGVELDGAGKLRQGFAVIALIEIDQGAVVDGVGEFWIDGNRAIKIGQGFVGIVFVVMAAAAVVKGQGIFPIELD